jgi:hypothetical protein
MIRYQARLDKSERFCLVSDISTNYGMVYSHPTGQPVSKLLTKPEWEDQNTVVYSIDRAPDGVVHVFHAFTNGKLKRSAVPQSFVTHFPDERLTLPDLPSNRQRTIAKIGLMEQETNTIRQTTLRSWNQSATYFLDIVPDGGAQVTSVKNLTKGTALTQDKVIASDISDTFVVLSTGRAVIVGDLRANNVRRLNRLSTHIFQLNSDWFIIINEEKQSVSISLLNAKRMTIKRVGAIGIVNEIWSISVNPNNTYAFIGSGKTGFIFSATSIKRIGTNGAVQVINGKGRLASAIPDIGILKAEIDLRG